MTNLCRLVKEAKHDLLVISDSDVRVEPDYLLDVAASFADPKVGVVTAFFRGMTKGGFAADVDAVGVPTDASASTLVARKLGGIDFVLGNEMAKGWYRVELTRKPVWMVFPSERLGDFFKHELRWSELFSSTRTVLSTSPLIEASHSAGLCRAVH